MRSLPVLLTFLLTACPSESKDPVDSGTTETGDERTFEEFVNVTTPWVAEDTTCYTPGADWNVRTPDSSCQVDVTLSGEVVDFQEETSVADATVQVWLNDDITSSSTTATAADADGAFTVEAVTCTPFGYGTSTPAEWEQTVDTYEIHQVYGYSSEGSVSVDFNSVSESTARIIPGLIGVEWDRTAGIIAGTAYDCNETAIQYAQIFIHDGSGGIPATGDVFYFSTGAADLPTDLDNQPYTNTNGLWVAINVPEGTWTVEMWGWDGSTHVKLGATVLTIIPASVNISNIYHGNGDGIYYPENCLSACGG